jgi:hypothetical protein
MPPLVVEIVFVEELFFDAQAEVGKFDQSRVVTEMIGLIPSKTTLSW